MVTRLVVTLVAASLLVGCWPARFTYRTGIKGVVISADDGKPVAGASIRLAVPREGMVPAMSIVTTREGRFEVEPYYQWHIASVLGENWPVKGSLEVSAPGYLPHMQELSWSRTGPHTQDLGTVRLTRLQ